MLTRKRVVRLAPTGLPKAQSGIKGLDEITGGGLPRGRPTLICGGPGCGKSLFATEFLVRGAVEYDEPGVLMTFEETPEEIASNVASLGFDLNALCTRKKILIDHVRVERSEIEENGEYDLEALFIRLGYAIDSIGAKRVALDTVESLFAALPNEVVVRAELRRLFAWLKEKGMTSVITAEEGSGTLTRQGLEEYVSDCVILLDHRVTDLISTRRLRVLKYRGSTHGTNEYPFLIDRQGISVLPISSLGLSHKVSDERVLTGIPRLDTMLGGRGLYRGSSALISGTAGTGKTSVAAHFADAVCRSGERCIYFAFEESPDQIMRNMRSIGIDLMQWVKRRLLIFHAVRPTAYGLEMQLAIMHKQVGDFRPSAVIVDPITNLTTSGTKKEVESILTRLIDFLKSRQITSLFTSLTRGDVDLAQTDIGISSLMDAWILLQDLESSGERNRGIYVLKSRGMAHSNQIREFKLTANGVQLSDVYLGPSGVLTGTARVAQEASERAQARDRRQEFERKQRELDRKRRALEGQITALRDAFQAEEEQLTRILAEEEAVEESISEGRREMARLRNADRSEPKTLGSTQPKPGKSNGGRRVR